MRLALFTLESALSAEAVARFLREHGEAVVLIGRSRPFRPAAGGALRQGWRHLRRSGPRLLPYLWANYALPQGLGRLRRLAGGRGTLAGLAAARGLPVHDLDDVNDAATAAALRAARPDLLVSLHFDQIFTAATLALAPLGGINLHPSLLPRHRGPVPAIWALAEPEPAFGVTIHRLVPRIDAGAILAQAAVPLPPGTTASAAARALHLAGVPLLSGVLAGLAAGACPGQGRPLLPYCPFPPPALLRGLAARGRRLVDAADLRSGLACRIG
ncbi:formyltransferase family protein [Paeniroseomonas aquatica]|uniref:Formyltransferase family protein n=1 Tax=Paeniroseomonas aquatica TaxID=373043 RepID=A0ABT8A8Q1_9PROT|nr:formyltransferase family protein [Paeniroseomonas aquatica]MDN3566182.1 formyltransferase family protein [Paeniroseomonas aquatica]